MLNGGLAWLAERRQVKQSVKVVARLVQSEMELNNLAVSGALFMQKTWAPLKSLLSSEAWLEHRPMLAGVMKDSEWSLVESYYMQMQATASLAETYASLDRVDPGEIDRLKGEASRIVKADAVIRKYSGVEDSELSLQKQATKDARMIL